MRSDLQDRLEKEVGNMLALIAAEAMTYTMAVQRALFFREMALTVVAAALPTDPEKLPETFNTPTFRKLVLTPALNFANMDKYVLRAVMFRLGLVLLARADAEYKSAYESGAPLELVA